MQPLLSSSSSNQTKKLSLLRPPSKEKIQTKMKQKQKQIPRNPLQDLNSRSSKTSSSSSVSGEASKGCLRFCLAQSSSSSSIETPLGGRPVKCFSKTPNSAPVGNARFEKGLSTARSASSKENLTKGNIFEKPILQKPGRSKKNPTALHLGQSGKKPTFKSALKSKNDSIPSKFSSGSGEVKQKQHKTLVRTDDNDEQLTPVTKLGSVSGLNCRVTDNIMVDDRLNSSSSNTKTPPVQASVSPEIQCDSSLLLSTTTTPPACYSAGYIVSGVSDKRKCKPKGLLTIGDKSLGFGKPNSLNSCDDTDEGENCVWDSSMSMMPLPADASMHWFLSPCDEAKESSDESSWCDGSEIRSTLSDNGFSSEICNISSGRSLSIDNSGTRIKRRSISSLSPCELSEFRFMDQLCGAAPSKESKEERQNGCDLGEESSPFSIDTLGSQNVIQTPESNSSSYRYPENSWLEAKDLKMYHDDSNLKSLTTSLQSANLSPKIGTTNSDSVDNMLESHLQVSWRDGLNTQILEMNGFDYCRCLSDDEENVNDSSRDQLMKFHPSPNDDLDAGNHTTNSFGPTEFVNKEPACQGQDREKLRPVFPGLSAESISTDGGSLLRSEDSDWMASYKNHFEV